jgi:hypothetical protein
MMASVKDYFEKRDANKPAPKWIYGDRVSGRVGGIPVVGQVIREDYIETDLVLVHLDLPINVGGEMKNIVHVPSKGMKRLKVYE